MSSQAAEARTVPVIQSVVAETASQALNDYESGIHFLTDDQNNALVIERADEHEHEHEYELEHEHEPLQEQEQEPVESEPDGGGVYEMDGASETTGIVRSKSELLEYLIRDDGSVACKLCGEVLASRTHWYRHKYKLHVTTTSSAATIITAQVPAVPVSAPVSAPAPVPVTVSLSPSPVAAMAAVNNASPVSASPSPLFRCTQCNTFFKSRKGYMGHLSARHSNDTEDEAVSDVGATETVTTTEASPAKVPRRKDACSRGADWEQQREKEEKLVADIIDRVRRECEAQGAAVSRRGYSRRSTVMNTCN